MKRIIGLILICVLLGASAIMFASCSKKNNQSSVPPAHVHKYADSNLCHGRYCILCGEGYVAPTEDHELDDERCRCTVCGDPIHDIHDGVCTRCGEKAYTLVNENGIDYVLFGSYPQSEVSPTLAEELTAEIDGKLPSASNRNGWHSYRYYEEGRTGDFMWYRDISYEDEEYRGVYFSKMRPSITSEEGNDTTSYQDENGYNEILTTIYWFKYEPIKWRILSKDGDDAFIMATVVLDAQQFKNSLSKKGDIFPNNWEYSEIREWLNSTFMSTAFDRKDKDGVEEQSIIYTMINNKTTSYNGSIGGNANATIQNNTRDKVFLLSYSDISNTAYGFNGGVGIADEALKLRATPYALAQGVYANNSENYVSAKAGYATWWLRSAAMSDAELVYYVNTDKFGDVDGEMDYTIHDTVKNASKGVVPALHIKLN